MTLAASAAARERALGAQPVDQLRAAQAAGHLEPVRLDPHDEPDPGTERARGHDVLHRHVGIEQHRARVAPHRVGDVALERPLRLDARVASQAVEQLDQRRPVVEREHGQAAAVVGQPADSVVINQSRHC